MAAKSVTDPDRLAQERLVELFDEIIRRLSPSGGQPRDQNSVGDHMREVVAREIERLGHHYDCALFGGSMFSRYRTALKHGKTIKPDASTLLDLATYLRVTATWQKPESWLNDPARWGQTPEESLQAIRDYLRYGLDTPRNAPKNRWVTEPTVSEIIDKRPMSLSASIGLGDMDVYGLRMAINEAVDRIVDLYEQARSMSGAVPEAEELPCDNDNFLWLWIAAAQQLGSTVTPDSVQVVAADSGIEPGRVRRLLCGNDLPTAEEMAALSPLAKRSPEQMRSALGVQNGSTAG